MTEGNEKYRLTLWGCLAGVLQDYGIDISHITPKMGEHMVTDFMETLEISGYLERHENEIDAGD